MTNKKDSLFLKYMKFWYGIIGPLDEQKKSVMEHIGNTAFFIMFLSIDFFTLVSFIVLSFVDVLVAYLVLVSGILVAIIVMSIYIQQAGKKTGLTELEVESKDLPKAKKTAWIRGMMSGLLFGIVMVLVQATTNATIHTYLNNLFSLISLYLLLFYIIGFGVVVSLINVHKIKVVDENDEE